MAFWKKWFEPKPFNEGYLRVSPVHEIYYREFGNPKGKPAVCLHGGPGYRSNADTAKNFNLHRRRVVLFDQRGAGRSRPAGEVKDNTTPDLVEDIRRLLDFLQIKDKVLVYGSSWGSTLAMLFAEKYPERVERLVVSKVFLANAENQAWETEYAGWLYPDVWEKIAGRVKGGNSVPQYYNKLILSRERKKQEEAVRLYGSYEFALGSLEPEPNRGEVSEDDINSSKIYINYAAHDFFLKDDEIIKNIRSAENIPLYIIHNRLDLLCPLNGAYRLYKGMKNACLNIVPAIGHGSRQMNREIKKYLKNL